MIEKKDKKAYKSPVLRKHGSVERVTLGPTGSGSDAGPNQRMMRTMMGG